MDQLVFTAAEFVIENDASISRVQRELELTFNEASDVFDQLEAAGIIGPFEYGSKQREVLIKDIEEAHEILSNE